MTKIALITGITGQDGSYLAEFLLEKGYEVHGIIRRASCFNTSRIEHLYFEEWIKDADQKKSIELHYGDMTDSSSLIRIIQQVKPTEIYNLAAQSHVKVSFEVPEYTAESDAVGTGVDLTIKELAQIIQRNVGHTEVIIWDSTKPDGPPRKLMDVSKMTDAGWKAKIGLEEGIKKTYKWFLEN